MADEADRICIDCGKPYTPKAVNQVRCSSCKESKAKQFFAIRKIRWDFALVARNDPKEARRIMKEMEAKEGKEWVKTILGDTYTKVRRNQYRFQKETRK